MAQKAAAAQASQLPGSDTGSGTAAGPGEDTNVTPTVRFVCPLTGLKLPVGEIDDHIIEALQQAIPSDPVMLSATLIHTACKDAAAKELCITTLKKYIGNVAKGERRVPSLAARSRRA